MNPILAYMRQTALAPVVALPSAEHAAPLADALMAAKLPVAEVTFRTDAAVAGIERMRLAQPEMLVGAGTVLTTDQADAALDAGASFIVAPGFDPVVVDHCLQRGVTVIPGVCTASELTQAVVRGVEAVKFFPAEAMGGLATLKVLASPFPPMHFMVTGGISQENMAPYLVWERILAVGGSWMVHKKLLEAGDYAKVTELARAAVDTVREYRQWLPLSF